MLNCIYDSQLEKKAKVGQYAAENGTINTICQFANEMPNLKGEYSEGVEDHLLA